MGFPPRRGLRPAQDVLVAHALLAHPDHALDVRVLVVRGVLVQVFVDAALLLSQCGLARHQPAVRNLRLKVGQSHHILRVPECLILLSCGFR